MFQISTSCISKDNTEAKPALTRFMTRGLNSPIPLSLPDEASTGTHPSLPLLKKKHLRMINYKNRKPRTPSTCIIHVDEIRPLSSYITQTSASPSRPTSSYIITTDLNLHTPDFDEWMLLEAVRRSIQDQRQQQLTNPTPNDDDNTSRFQRIMPSIGSLSISNPATSSTILC